jgi:HAE1 family hydrophobic/amphiphilic exporter-1
LPNPAARVSIEPDVELLLAYGEMSTSAERDRHREEMLRQFSMFPEFLATVGPSRLGTWNDPLDSELSIVVTGGDPETLGASREECRRLVGTIPGLSTVVRGETAFEAEVEFSSEKLKEFGITEATCRKAMVAARQGLTIGKIKDPTGAVLPVVFRTGERPDPEAIDRLKLRTNAGELIPLSAVATISRGTVPAYEYRENGRPAILVNCSSTATISDAEFDALKKSLAGFAWPAGRTWRIVRGGSKN